MYTVVTGLFDIGRGNWNAYRRPIQHYLQYFYNLLQLKAPMVIFCEKTFVDFVKKCRSHMNYKTTVIGQSAKHSKGLSS